MAASHGAGSGDPAGETSSLVPPDAFRINDPELVDDEETPQAACLNRMRQAGDPKWWVGLAPIVETVKSYTREDAIGDVTAGITVGVMLVPQGMAYAKLAEMPPEYGLYSSLIPVLTYAVFGTSRQLAVGPVAITSMLSASAVAGLADPDVDPSGFQRLSIALCMASGLLQLLMWVLNLSFLVHFLAHPVVLGFTNGASIVICLGQLASLLGIKAPRKSVVHSILYEVGKRLQDTNWRAFLLGSMLVALLFFMKWLGKKHPKTKLVSPHLLCILIATVISYALMLKDHGVFIVGDIPSGLPGFSAPSIDDIFEVLPAALPLTVISYLESIAVAQVLAGKKGYEISSSQELLALGLADVFGSFFSSFACSGGFGRSAVNNAAGARTTLASILSAGIVALALLFLMPLFFHLPSTALAAIVMQSTYSLIDFSEVKMMWKVNKRDWTSHMVAVVATCFLGVTWGLLLAVLTSLGLLVQRLSRPYTAVLGQIEGRGDVYRNVRRYHEARTVPGVAVLRVDAEICFANTEFFKDKVRALVSGGADAPGGTAARHVVVDASGINDIDLAGVHAVLDLAAELKKGGASMSFASVKGPVRSALLTSGAYTKLGERDAVEAAQAAMDAPGGVGGSNGGESAV